MINQEQDKSPRDIESERGLLGAIITDTKGECVGEVLNIVKAVDFYSEANGMIFNAVMSVHDQNIIPDMITVREELLKKNAFDKAGGIDYFMKLAELPVFSANASYYARLVKDKSVLRSAVRILGTLKDNAHTTHDAEDYIKELEEGLFNLLEETDISAPKKVSDIIGNVVDELCSDTETSGVSTGYYELDDMLGCLHNGEMTVVAGRPSMGKTVLGVNILEHVACKLDKPVAMFSIETSAATLITRMLVSKSGVDSYKIKNLANDHEKATVASAGSEYIDSNIWIDDSGRLSTIELRTKARRLKKQHDIQLIVIDYLQLMTSPGCESRQVEVTAISREVKALAKELDIPIIVLSQLNRGNEARIDKRPMMSDLRESGAIEQDADAIILLHREDYYKRNDPDYTPNDEGELIIAKQKNGPTGTVKLRFSGSTMRFYDRSNTPFAGY